MNKIFIDTTATREHTLSSEPSFVFTLGALDSRIVLHILGKTYNQEGSEAERLFSQLIDFVRFGVVSLRDAESNTPVDLEFEDVEIPFIGKRKALREDIVRRIRADVLIELGREIRRDNLLTDEERKKSSGLLVSSETQDS